MMEHYYGVFNARLIDNEYISSHALNQQDISGTAAANRIRDNLLNNNIHRDLESSGVQVTLSNLPESLPGRPEKQPGPDQPYEYYPQEGVTVKTDRIDLNNHIGNTKTISMVEAYVNGKGIEQESLSSVASLLSSKSIATSKILESSGVISEGIQKASILTKIEVGNYNGDSFLYGSDGTLIKGWQFGYGINRISKESNIALEITSHDGNKINLSLSILDEVNIDDFEGASRSLAIEFESSKLLSKDEVEQLTNIFTNIDGMITDFNKDQSIEQVDLEQFLSDSVSTSSVFSDVSLTLNWGNSSYDDGAFRTIEMGMQNGNPKVTVSEDNMVRIMASRVSPAASAQEMLGYMKGLDYGYYYTSENAMVWAENDDLYIEPIKLESSTTNKVFDISDYIDEFYV
jgi:hypothetical protein